MLERAALTPAPAPPPNRAAPPITLLHLPLPRRSSFFDELVGRAKLREEEEEERRRRARDKFAVMLRHLRKLSAETTWEEFVTDYEQEPEFKAVS